MKSRRLLIFIDESNVIGAARSSRKKVDWVALRSHLTKRNGGRELIEAVVYAGLPPSLPEWQATREKRQKFLYWLRTQGFLVLVKEGSPTEHNQFKANVDVMMAIDAVEFAVSTHPDVVVLATGDADFAHLAIALRRRGIRVEVASVEDMLGGELKAAVNEVIDLTPLIDTFAPLDISS